MATGPDAVPRPPRTAEALLSLFLPGGGIRESVLGDLEEMYALRVGRPRGGRLRADRWYWAQAVRIAAGYGARRISGKRYRGFAPAERPADVGMTMTRGDIMAGWIRQVRFSMRSLFRSPARHLPAT